MHWQPLADARQGLDQILQPFVGPHKAKEKQHWHALGHAKLAPQVARGQRRSLGGCWLVGGDRGLDHARLWQQGQELVAILLAMDDQGVGAAQRGKRQAPIQDAAAVVGHHVMADDGDLDLRVTLDQAADRGEAGRPVGHPPLEDQQVGVVGAHAAEQAQPGERVDRIEDILAVHPQRGGRGVAVGLAGEEPARVLARERVERRLVAGEAQMAH